VEPEEKARVARLLNLQESSFPFKYLGFPISEKKLTIANLEPLWWELLENELTRV
jgi:hypothetical protein